MNVKYNEQGLVPAIAQDARTGKVLMLAWMNAESLRLTQESGYAHYFSRSRQALWKKGETSGNVQRVLDLHLDCDADTVLLRVEQTGPACHTGDETCWGDPPATIIGQLTAVLEARKAASPDDSNTARLLSAGMGKILEKVAEESEELRDALESETDERVVSEAADLLYHVLVGFAARGLDPQAVAYELARRFGTSGIEENAGRSRG